MAKSYNFSKKDEINSTASKSLQDAKGETVTVTGAAIVERIDDSTGETKEVGLIATNEFGVLSTISATSIRGLDLIIDYMEETNSAGEQVTINAGVSKGGREFITLVLN